MKKFTLVFTIVLSILIFCTAGNGLAFWMWTPETNKWVNPKYDVKDTPEEQLAFAKQFYDARDYKKATNEFEKLIKSYPKSKEAAEAQYYIGACLEDQGKLYDAFKAYQKVVEKYPFSERSFEVVDKQYKIGERMLEGEGKKSKFVSTVVGGGYEAIDIFRAVIKNAPYGKNAAPAQYKIGLYLKEKGMHQEARDEFEKVVNDYPNSEWVKAATYQIALTDAHRSSDAPYDQKVTQAAVEELKEFTRTYPDAELSQKAEDEIKALRNKEAQNNFLIGRFYEKQKNYESAKIYYETIVQNYKDSPWVVKASAQLRELGTKKK